MAHLSYKQYIDGGNPPGITNWVKFNWINGGAPLTVYRYVSIGNTVGGYDTTLGHQKVIFTSILRKSSQQLGHDIGLQGASDNSTHLQSNRISYKYRLLLPLPDNVGVDDVAQYMNTTYNIGDDATPRIQSMIDNGYYVIEKTTVQPKYWIYDASLPVHITEA